MAVAALPCDGAGIFFYRVEPGSIESEAPNTGA